MAKKAFIIAVSGGPATGKSTLAKKLAKHYQAKAFLEGEEKDFPPRIWKDIKSGKDQLELILYFRNKGITEYLAALKVKAAGGRAILDTFFLTNDVYIDEWIKDGFQRELAKKTAQIDYQIMPAPDLIICLSCNDKKSREFLHRRGRKNEMNRRVFQKYRAINAVHDEFFKNLRLTNIIFIDRSDMDFNNQRHFNSLIDQIEKKLENSDRIWKKYARIKCCE